MRSRITAFVTGALLVAVSWSAACSKPLIPTTELVWQPRPTWRSPTGEHPGKRSTRTHPLPECRAGAMNLAGLLQIAGSAVPEHRGDWVQVDAAAGGLRVTASPAGHRRVARMLRAVRDASDLDFTLSIRRFTVPLLTANRLGPIQRARGGGDSSLARVPLRAAVWQRLERLAALEGGPVTQSRGVRISGPVGSWGDWFAMRQRVYLADVELSQSTSTPGILRPSPTVELARTGLFLAAGALPLSREEGVLLAFHVVSRVRQPDTVLTHLSAGGNTEVAVTLPASLFRESLDAVRLGPGESLALVIPGRDPERVQLVCFTPSFRKARPDR